MKPEDLLYNAGSEGGEGAKPKSPLVSLQQDLEFYKEAIQEVSSELLGQGYTQYPIFIAHQHEVSVGEKILDHLELGTQWTIHASSLEELTEKGLIQEEKKDHFIKQFKDPNQYACLLVIVPQGANFVYYPYGKDQS